MALKYGVVKKKIMKTKPGFKIYSAWAMSTWSKSNSSNCSETLCDVMPTKRFYACYMKGESFCESETSPCGFKK